MKQPEFTLRRAGDQVLLRHSDGQDEVPVRLSWVRPVSAPGREVSILQAQSKKELVLLHSLDQLDAPSRAIAEEELTRRRCLPRITRVLKTMPQFGNRYWEVETDRGARQFLMRSPETNTIWVTDDHFVVRDTFGNCYEVESLIALDPQSRAEAMKVL